MSDSQRFFLNGSGKSDDDLNRLSLTERVLLLLSLLDYLLYEASDNEFLDVVDYITTSRQDS
jgi:hypothetical protein